MTSQTLGGQIYEPAGVEIRARDVEFDWSATPRHWIKGEPAADTETFPRRHAGLRVPGGRRPPHH